jgi:hypothetical protein
MFASIPKNYQVDLTYLVGAGTRARLEKRFKSAGA